jgi:hypothetical protein
MENKVYCTNVGWNYNRKNVFRISKVTIQRNQQANFTYEKRIHKQTNRRDEEDHIL